MTAEPAQRLDRVVLENFRGVREGDVQGLADVNVVIGRNNAGKSTLVEAIFRGADALARSLNVKDTVDVLGRNRDDLWASIRLEPEAAPAELWYRGDSANPPSVQMFVGDATWLAAGFWTPPSVRRFGLKVPSATPSNFARQVTLFRPQDAANKSIEQRLWRQILSTRQDKALAASLSTIFGVKIEGIQLPPDGRMTVLYPDIGLPIDAQGDGMRAAARCLTLLTVLRQTLFLVEEPECHQHPGSLQRFASAMCSQAKAQGVQLLLTTHSLECAQAFLTAAAEAGSEGAVLHLGLEDGVLKSRTLDPETFTTLRDTGLDPRFLDAYA